MEKFVQLGAFVIFVDLDEEAGSLLCKKINDTTVSEKALFIAAILRHTCLTHAMSISLARQARVNAISPGWIDVSVYHGEGSPARHSKEDENQHLAGRVGCPEDIAEMVMFLCDNKRASFITGENIVIDGGMSKLMIYHGDKGWQMSQVEMK